MVDLLGIFRRRPAKRGRPSFARPQDDITTLEDSLESLLPNAIRDAPPIAREAPIPGFSPARPQLPRRPGFLAVHSVEKSFGTRQVVRGVSIYVRRGEAVGLLGPNGAGKTTEIGRA